jgi:signal transduction histidine kinase
LVVSSVLICYALGFATVLIYLSANPRSEDDVRADGVFLAHEMLQTVPAGKRSAKLEELRPDFRVPLQLEKRTELEQRLGRSITPAEPVLVGGGFRDHWTYVAFEDADMVLAAGPVNQRRPHGHRPIGFILAFLTFPALAGFLALTIERGVSRVEKAAEALSEGDLATRVDLEDGASRELAIRFNEMAERVERLVRDRDELIQAVSHELGSPLTRIRFHLELLDGEVDADRVESLRRELDALDELVAELIGYVQSEEGELRRERIRPAQGLADIVELATLEFSDADDIQIQLEGNEEIELSVDPRGFMRAIENLVRNAVRYAESEVWVRARTDGSVVEVVIEDDGPGIPESMREAVLTPFVRLDADRNRSTGGVGLGLAIVDRIIKRHGGTLEITDSPDGGARIVTTWPKDARTSDKTS